MEANYSANEVQLDVNSLFCIFSLLDVKDKQNVAQVCSYWKNISYLPSLWKDVSVNLHRNIHVALLKGLEQRKITRFVCRGTTEEDLASLFSAIPKMTSLNIYGCRFVTQQFLQQNLPKLKELVTLLISHYPRIDLESLYQVLSTRGFPLNRLKRVTLTDQTGARLQVLLLREFTSLEEVEYSEGMSYEESNCNFLDLVQYCPNIKSLNIGYTCSLSQETWTTALQVLPLRSLELNYMWTYDREDYCLLKLIADNAPNLESLKCDSLTIDSRHDVIYPDIFLKLKNLKDLSISIAYNSFGEIGDDQLKQRERKLLFEISKITQLETLKMNLCSTNCKFTGETIYSLVENMSNLRSLDLDPVGFIGMEYADLIGEQLKKLNSLKVAVEEDATGIGFLCRNLRNLIDVNIIHPQLLNKDVKEIASGLFPNKLKSLNIAGCKKVKDQGVIHIANRLKSLTTLDISSCSVSDKSVSIISEELNHLQMLCVTGRKVTDHGAIVIGKHLKGLEKLKISGTKVGDQGFAFICNNLPDLRTLQAFCDLVTDQGFSQGANGLRKLTTLQIGSHRISAKGIENSLKHLNFVFDFTIRSVAISYSNLESVIEEMPCLAKLNIIRCKHTSHIPQYNPRNPQQTYYQLCHKNGISFLSPKSSCRKIM